MASVAVMLFNQQVFHLECLLMLLLFRIKSQSVIAYKSVVYKWVIYMLFLSLLKMKLGHMTLFLCLSGILFGRYYWESLPKAGGLGKI